ncbi:amino acid adenylation domain-containing protein [Staphylococcus gallinarum]|uniref:amino acid adenylation domain-containing protein n=1 Tax=Staphylococcus gallinarum TaxID=1293 RepID=UPI002DB7EED8|nr:amino acid adenylation domain-containing protein [Staphylococcus gallinarum]MEB7040093.1 amino acid adenylation domain-containing protein [Staphylococcus gallinarum]
MIIIIKYINNRKYTIKYCFSNNENENNSIVLSLISILASKYSYNDYIYIQSNENQEILDLENITNLKQILNIFKNIDKSNQIIIKTIYVSFSIKIIQGTIYMDILHSNVNLDEYIIKSLNNIMLSYSKYLNLNIEIQNLHVLSSNDQENILTNFSKGEDLNYTYESIYNNINASIQSNKDKIAIKQENKLFTYEELKEEILHIEQILLINNIRKNDTVCVFLKKGVKVIALILAIMKIGAIYIPISNKNPKERVNYILRDCSCKVIVTDNSLIEDIDKSYPCINLDFYKNKIIKNLSQNNSANVRGNDIAYIMYTSGTTGNPKGVPIRHESVVNFSYSMQKNFEITIEDNILQLAELSFDVSIFEILTTLICGASITVISDNQKKSINKLSQILIEEKVTIAEIPPVLLPLLNPEELPSLRLVSVGGEKFPGSLVEKWTLNNKIFVNGYGPTESTVAVTLKFCSRSWTKTPPIGRPIQNHNIYILNDDLSVLPIGGVGEICISGIGVTKGYLNNPALNNEIFVSNPYGCNTKHKTLYKTGDLGRWLPSGDIEILGRKDRQTKIRGIRVELEEIESILLQQPYIINAAVEIKKEGNTNELVFFLVIEDENIKTENLHKSLSEKLPNNMIAKYIKLLDEIPLTVNGKVNRKKLKESIYNGGDKYELR